MRKLKPSKKVCFITGIILGVCCLGIFCFSGRNTRIREQQEKLPEIVIMTAKVNTENFDGDMISKALDEYAAPLIHAHVRLEFIEQERSMQIINKYASYNKFPDAFLLWNGDFSQKLYQSGQLMPLNDFLEKDGTEIADAFEDKVLLHAHCYNGTIYAIPTLADRAHATCLEYRVEIAKKYGLDMSKVHSVSDLDGIFSQLIQAAPEILPISEVNYQTWDPLTDSLGVLPEYGQNTTVVNLYETKEYEELCHLIHEWNHKGYLRGDDSTMAVNAFMRSPWIFSRIRRYSPNLPYMDSADAGEEMACIVFTDSFVYTDLTRYASWAVSSKTEYPKETLAFLKLMYTDSTVMNLLTYGIEGIHYQVLDEKNGVISFPEGVDIFNSGYAQFRGYFYGNEFLSYIWEGYPLDLWEQIQNANLSSIHSKAYGFQYNPVSVSNQAAHCQYVVNKYHPLLAGGIGDTGLLLKEFRHELEIAGIKDVIQEKQKQLDDWIDSQKEGN